MREFLKALGLIGLFGIGSAIMISAFEEERRRKAQLQLEIEASRLTEEIFIDKIEKMTDKVNSGQYMTVPVPDRYGNVTMKNVWIPETKQREMFYLVDRNKQVYFVPSKLRVALIPFKEGDRCYLTTIHRPGDTFREVEVISPEKPEVVENTQEKMIKFG